jgi:PAS domain S-box-containing protein
MTMTPSRGKALDGFPLNSSGSAAAPPRDWTRIDAGEHLVQFYEAEPFLLDALCGYIGTGLREGEACIVIATGEHQRGLDERLGACGVDIAAARASGQYIVHDAAETLSMFMDDGSPDAGRFAEVIGKVVVQAAGEEGRRVRAFGEMVAILWEEGNHDAAIRLEALWNDLAEAHAFALLCAYPICSFGEEAHGGRFENICRHHTKVIPGESYSALPREDAKEREIALLQQKAAALEAEIRARRETERQLRERESELADFLDNAVEGLHRVGADGTILWANSAELALLGYEEHEYIGRHIADFHADRPVIDDILARLLKGETLYNYPARLRARNGSIRNVLIHSNARWEGGELRYTRCFTRDITEQKQAQDQRDRLLAREQAARRELELANEDLKDFAYIVSHDLKEPLRGISNYSAFLLKDHADGLGSEGLPKVETIKRLARRSYDLLDAVLAFSRIGREQMRLEEIEVEQLFARAFDNVRGRVDDEGAIVTFEPTRLSMRCDPELALQVLTNLISNALKYNGSSPKRVEIHCQPGERVEPVICVKDNGIGIDLRHHDNIFRMFKRLHARDLYGGGTGAGLAIVKRIVDRHNGRIWVESEPGAGSAFYFTLGEPRVGLGDDQP